MRLLKGALWAIVALALIFPMAAGATSTPALGPIPIGFTIWVIALILALALILTELDNPGSPSVGRRVIAFVFAISAWIFGLAPTEYVWIANNGTIVTATGSLAVAGGGITGAGLLAMDTGILVYTMLRILELLVVVMNRRRITE